uniref:Uncharacterized protein n=1 Tax=Oryctolagus cuniculus TaxID=9986 RepID=A0A5F9CIC2_RABIT
MVHPPMAATRAGPPSYNLETGQGDYVCSPHGYGAIPTSFGVVPRAVGVLDLNTAALPLLRTGLPTHHPRVDNIHSRVVTCYPVNSVAVGIAHMGCWHCRWWLNSLFHNTGPNK